MTIEWALQQLTPGAAWSIIDDQLVWHDKNIPQPTQAEIDSKVSEYDTIIQKESVRAERDRRIEAIMWRVERYESEVRQGITPMDDIAALDAYIQALRDVSLQEGFPEEVFWPIEP
jgi:hypothetical protein